MHCKTNKDFTKKAEAHIRKHMIKVDHWKVFNISIRDREQTKQRASKKSTDQFLEINIHNKISTSHAMKRKIVTPKRRKRERNNNLIRYKV